MAYFETYHVVCNKGNKKNMPQKISELNLGDEADQGSQDFFLERRGPESSEVKLKWSCTVILDSQRKLCFRIFFLNVNGWEKLIWKIRGQGRRRQKLGGRNAFLQKDRFYNNNSYIKNITIISFQFVRAKLALVTRTRPKISYTDSLAA